MTELEQLLVLVLIQEIQRRQPPSQISSHDEAPRMVKTRG